MVRGEGCRGKEVAWKGMGKWAEGQRMLGSRGMGLDE